MLEVSEPSRWIGRATSGELGRRWSAVATALLVAVALAGAVGLAADPPGVPAPAARAAYNAAAALQNRGAWDLAASAWEALLRDHPGDPLVPRATHNLGLCLVEEGKWSEAERRFRAAVDAALALPGGDPETAGKARYELGRGAFAAARQSGTPEAFRGAAGALAAYLDGDAASRGAPARVAEARSLLAEALWQAGDRAAALDTWERFLREHADTPRAADVLYGLGVARAESGDAAAAAAALGRFAERFPDHPLADEVAIRRADLALAAGEAVEAARLVVEVAKRKESPRSLEALERLGTALWRQDRHAASAAAFDMLAERRGDDPRSATARLSASAAWAAAGKFDEARSRLETVLDGSSAAVDHATIAEAAERLARLELSHGAPDAALPAADRGLAVAPGGTPVTARLLRVRAEALAALPDRRDEALATLERLRAGHGDDPVAADGLALEAALLLDAGRSAEALTSAERYLALAPEGRGVDPDLPFAMAIRAEAMLAAGDPRGAASAYGDLLDSVAEDPRRGHWRVRRGAALAAAEAWQDVHDVLGPLAGAAPGSGGIAGDDVPEALLLDATALVELGRPSEALPLLARFARDHTDAPRRHEAALVAIRARRETDDLHGAREAAEKLVADADLPAKLAERAWYRLGQARRDEGDVAAAIEAYREARKHGVGGALDASTLLAEGWCHEALGDLAAAERCWTEIADAQQAVPATLPALLARADVRLRTGAAAAGLADAERVLATPGLSAALDAQARLVAGLCEGSLGRHDEAVTRLAALAEAHPGAADADRVLLELAVALVQSGRPVDAERVLEDLRARHPRSPRVAESWLETGECRFDAGDTQGAAEAYRRVIGATEGSAADVREQALHKLAWCASLDGDPVAAASAFTAQLDAFPLGRSAADGRVMLGDALFRSGRVEEAIEVLQKALADPSLVSSADLVGLATIRAAECEAKQGKFDASLRRLDEWAGPATGEDVSDSTRTLCRFARAQALHGLGRTDDALAAFRLLADDALGSSPRGAAFAGAAELAARARLMEGEILFEQERHADAITAFFKVAYGFGDRAAPPSFHPWQAQATFEAARCCDVLGKPAQARSLYAELVERHPDAPWVDAARKRLDALGATPP